MIDRFLILRGMHHGLIEDGFVFLDGKYQHTGKQPQHEENDMPVLGLVEICVKI